MTHKPLFSKTSLIIIVIAIGGLLASFYYLLSVPQRNVSVTSPEMNQPVDVEKVKARAEGGDAEAQYGFGSLYAKGQSVPLDYKEAAKWYRLAADQGHAIAQKHLGELYEAGQGVPHDEAEAAKWYQRAAEQGFADAQYCLAVLYAMGRGVTRNDVEAVRWYRMAAERGDKLAQYNLGQRHIAGKGVPQDRVEAYKWLKLAAAQGLPDPVEVLDELKGKMTAEQITEGKRRVATFVPAKSIQVAH